MSAGRRVNTQSRDWCTPPKYAEAVHRFFFGRLALDPCSNEHSLVNANTHYNISGKVLGHTPSKGREAFDSLARICDGLKESWDVPSIYVNPPYGRDKERGTSIKDWLCRCAAAHRDHESEVLALVPVATNTVHWKQHVFGAAAAVCFLYDTRLKFWIDGKESKKGAPMACAMVLWGREVECFRRIFSPFGAVVRIEKEILNDWLEKQPVLDHAGAAAPGAG